MLSIAIILWKSGALSSPCGLWLPI